MSAEMAVLVWMYLVGMLATTFVVLEINVPRVWQAVAIVMTWPVALPVKLGLMFRHQFRSLP